MPLQAADHDLRPAATLFPLGILEVDSGQLFISFGLSRETSEFIADGLESWWRLRRAVHQGVRKIVIELDNGPHVQTCHSKYNPVERCWSCLERH